MRTRGILLERLSGGRAVVLTRSGAFCEVWLRGPDGSAPVGAEVSGLPLPRWLSLARQAASAWPRAAVATAVAFGAAGALFAAIYLRPDSGPGAGLSGRVPGEETAGAQTASEPVAVAPPAPQAVSVSTIMSRSLDAPRLSGSLRLGNWGSLRLVAEEGRGLAVEAPDFARALRRALASSSGAAGAPTEQAKAGQPEQASGPPGGERSAQPALLERPPASPSEGRTPRAAPAVPAGVSRGDGREPAGSGGESASSRRLAVPAVRDITRGALDAAAP